MYILTQLLGAVVGYELLKSLIPQNYIKNPDGEIALCVTSVNNSISLFEAFMIEFILTSALILISCSHWDPNNRLLGDSVPLRMGNIMA